MNDAWSMVGIGVLFCAGGCYLFHRNAFEENKKIGLPMLVILAGVVLIGIGMAKKYNLLP
jgi:hypothetical protein